MAPDGTIKLNLRRQFITTSLAGGLVGLYVLDERYIQVMYADIVLGLIDMRNANANARTNLIRPKRDLRGVRSTKQAATRQRIRAIDSLSGIRTLSFAASKRRPGPSSFMLGDQ